MISERFVINAHILARDRRNAAAHEAGHIVIAEHLKSYPTGAYIRPNPSKSKVDTSWIGSMHLGIDYCEIPKQNRMMIACAGGISEHIWNHPDDEFDEIYWEEYMSPTDWQMSGCDSESSDLYSPKSPFLKAARRTFDLLKGPLHNNVIKECRWLINNSRK
jgi:hypothetical protein